MTCHLHNNLGSTLALYTVNSNMPPRPGTNAAKDFFNGQCQSAQWFEVLTKYDEALQMVASTKKTKDLIEKDKFWREEFPALVKARVPPHFTLSELSGIMAWKLLRGKFRPLQKLCDSNSPTAVIDASTSAFKCATLDGSKSDWKGAMKALTTLKAIGEATAR